MTARVINNAATPKAMPPTAIVVVIKRKTPKRCPTRNRFAKKNSKRIGLCLRFEKREQDDFANGSLTQEKHRQAVNADTQTPGRRHAMLQSRQKGFVRDLHFLIAG